MASTKGKGNPLDALSLLVDAANAESSTPRGRGQSQPEAEEQPSATDDSSSRQVPTSNVEALLAGAVPGKVPSAAASILQEQRLAEMELREALQRQALEREALEGGTLLQQRAAMMGLGGLVNPSFSLQEAEYMQQLRLEALVQQRRQETLAQLALSQEYGTSPDVQAMLSAHQLRQAALLRDQELLLGGGAAGFEQGGLRGRDGPGSENPLLRLFEERDRQQKLAALANPAAVASSDLNKGPENGVPEIKSPGYNRKSTGNSLSLPGAKFTVLPCRARGMPMDHNAKTAYFVVPGDMKHGAELVCSYNTCRNAGTKFRYCFHCSVPVAKRNFFKRHKHIGKIPMGNILEGLYKDHMGDMNDEMSSSEASKEDVAKLGPKLDAQTILDKLVEKNIPELSTDNDYLPTESNIPPRESMEKLAVGRKKSWGKLLRKRPRASDEESIVSWVQQVLAVSDLGPSERENITNQEKKVEVEKEATDKMEEEPKVEEEVKKTVTDKMEEEPKVEEEVKKTVTMEEEIRKVEDENKADTIEEVPKTDNESKANTLEIPSSNQEKEGDSNASAVNNNNEAETEEEDSSVDGKTDKREDDVAESQVPDGAMSDTSSDSDGSVDLRAHKKAKTA